MLPHTERDADTLRDGARSSSSSRDKVERSVKSSGEEDNEERWREASIIDSEGESSDNLIEKEKIKILNWIRNFFAIFF